MNRKNKIIIAITSVLLLVIIGGYFIGDYFVTFALVRPDNGEVGTVNDPNAPKNDQNFVVDNNKKELEVLHDNWVKTIDVSEKEILSNDGLKLKAIEYMTNENSDKWIIMVHGYTSSNLEMLNRAYHYGQEGYNILLPNNRAHGNSEGTYIGMGWLDRLDILLWIDEIVKINPDAKIVLYGISMGAATVTMTSGEELPTNVKAVIEDCGYTDVWSMFENQLDYRFGIPPFPVLNFAHLVGLTKIGYDILDADATSQLSKSNLPFLFIHGDIDNYVPVEMAYKLHDAAKNEAKELLIIEGANHAESDYVNPKLYYDTVFKFLDLHVK